MNGGRISRQRLENPKRRRKCTQMEPNSRKYNVWIIETLNLR
jgi:hypothetical protein